MARAVKLLGLRACLTESIMDTGEGLPTSWALRTTDHCIQVLTFFLLPLTCPCIVFVWWYVFCLSLLLTSLYIPICASLHLLNFSIQDKAMLLTLQFLTCLWKLCLFLVSISYRISSGKLLNVFLLRGQSQKELYKKYNNTANGCIRIWFGIRQIMNSTDRLLLETRDAAKELKTGIHMVNWYLFYLSWFCISQSFLSRLM